jgi:hypothetical protein
MTTLNWLLCGFVALALAGGSGLAQDAPKKAKKPAEPKSILSGTYATMEKTLGLSKEQAEKIAAVLKSEKDKMVEFAKTSDAKSKEIAEKTKPLNDQLAELRKQESSLAADRAKIAAASRGEIDAVLSDQQRQNWKVYTMAQMVVGRGGRLSDEQMAKAQTVVAEEIKKAEAAGKKLDDRQVQEEMSKTVMAAVMTDADRKAAELAAVQGAAMRNVRGVKLTADQEAKVKAMAEAALAERKAALAKAAELTKELEALKAKDKAAGESLAKAVEEQVLTAEQKAKMKEAADKAKAPAAKKAAK